jgi:hypothetical protein
MRLGSSAGFAVAPDGRIWDATGAAPIAAPTFLRFIIDIRRSRFASRPRDD